MMKYIAALVLATALGGCGLRPVYGTGLEDSGPITVSQIDGRLGHRVRQELSRMLASGLPNVEPGSRLTVEIDEGIQRLPLRLDDGVSRTAVKATAEIVLFDSKGRIVVTGTETTSASFDTATSPYGDIALQNDARERVGRSLANNIFQLLARETASSSSTDTAS